MGAGWSVGLEVAQGGLWARGEVEIQCMALKCQTSSRFGRHKRLWGS